MSDLRRINELPTLPARPLNGHKGTFGTAVLVGGAVGGSGPDHRMIGGPCLATLSALRSGCGLARLAMPEPLLDAGLTIVPEATGMPLPEHADIGNWVHGLEDAHAIGIGPGLGRGALVEGLVGALIEWDHRPRVIDADALNAMATGGMDRVRGPVILTPHPGEWRRLAAATGVEGEPIHAETRPKAAANLVRRLDVGGGPVVLVLKGAGTVVTDGAQYWRCAIHEPALAVGGSGDVLTGIITGLLAQCHPRNGEAVRDDRLDLFSIACIGVQLHAMAAVRWAAEHGSAGMLARDLVDALPGARASLGR